MKKEVEESFRVAKFNLDGKNFQFALFLGSLAIEKTLKAIFVQKFQKPAPYTHNLEHLAGKCNLELDDSEINFLSYLSTINIDSRYPDIGRTFKENKSKKTFEKIEKIFVWLKEKL